jgi:hypothetical protein
MRKLWDEEYWTYGPLADNLRISIGDEYYKDGKWHRIRDVEDVKAVVKHGYKRRHVDQSPQTLSRSNETKKRNQCGYARTAVT